MNGRLRVGVIGCGLIGQVMHLPYLRELSDRYELAAIADLSESALAVCGERFGVERRFRDWRDMLAEPLDAVLVLTSGSHAPMAIAAAEAGKHVLVEKPMCFSVAEGQQMIRAAERAGVRLMVAYPKRYDPAFARLREELPTIGDLRLVRITTLESPIPPYVAHYPLFKGSDVAAETLQELKADDDARVASALGDADALSRQIYRSVLLDTLVHEFNTIRGILGEPDRLEYVDFREQSVSTMFDFGGVPCALHWVDLPGIARYLMEFAFYGPDRRLTLSYPSPFLRSAPTLLTIEGGDSNSSPRSWITEETVAYDEAFKRELVAFHEYVTQDREPSTPGIDGLRDIALCQAAVTVYRNRAPLERPTALAQ